MTTTQSLSLYNISLRYFKNEADASAFVKEIEAVVDEKVSTGNTTLESLLKEDLEIVRADIRSEVEKVKSELSKTIYLVGLVQFLAIVGSVIGIITFMHR